MRTMTIEKTVFTFDELNEEAKDRVREWIMDTDQYAWMVDGITGWEAVSDVAELHETFPDIWPEYVDPTMQRVTLHGGGTRYDITTYANWDYRPHISVAYEFDVPAFMKHHKLAGKWRALYNAAVNGEVTATVTNGYSIWGPRGDRFDCLNFEAPEIAHADDLEQMLNDDMTDRVSYLSRMFADEIAYQSSDEAIRESCEANGYEFTENGVPA